jgi:hypothetical protein
VVHVTSSQMLCEVEVEYGRVDTRDCIRCYYP